MDVGDLDLDGHVDLVVGFAAFPSPGVVSLFFGNGSGAFVEEQTFVLGTSYCEVRIAEVTGDNTPEVVVSAASGSVHVLTSDSQGIFGEVFADHGVCLPRRAETADLRNDGVDDIVVPAECGAAVVVVEYDASTGLFSSCSYAGGFGPRSLAVGEFDEANGPDVVTSNYVAAPSGLYILSNLDTFAGLPRFMRGDSNLDVSIDIGDAIMILAYLLLSGPGPCHDSMDVNDDGRLNIADPIHLLGFLFSAGSPPVGPWPVCDVDATADALGCVDESSCL